MNQNRDNRFDYIVVGAGSSGAVVARRLCEDRQTRVMLLEAGPGEPDSPEGLQAVRDGNQPAVRPGINWGFRAAIRTDTEPGARRQGSIFNYEGGRLVGGSSAVNATLACRGTPEDFQEWQEACGPQWSWEEVLAGYRDLEDDPLGPSPLHGRGGPMPIRREEFYELRPLQLGLLEAANRLGFPRCDDHNDSASTGVGVFPRNVVDGLRQSTKLTYLAPVADHANLRIEPGALVHRLVWGRFLQCIGVEVEIKGELRTLEAERIVICAGAMATPQILMRSGIGDPRILEPLGIPVQLGLSGVGVGLMDHPVIGIWGIPQADSCVMGEPARQVLLRHSSRRSSARNDLHICMMAGLNVRELFPHLADDTGATTIAGILTTNNRARSRGHVRITSTSPSAPADISINCLSEPSDIEPLMDGVRTAWSLLGHDALRSKFQRILGWTPGVIDSDKALRQAISSFVRPAAHIGCSARMGKATDSMSVVDGKGRIHGVENVWLADMSIAPVLPSAPPHLTVLMIAEKVAAGLLRGDA